VLNRISVLMVDDSPQKLMVLESILDCETLNIVKAGSGQEALRHLLREEFALILLDVNMPTMDGYETATLIRARKRSEYTPIIFITAYTMPERELVKGYSLGAVDYIFVPVVPKILQAKVNVFVDLFRMRRKLEESRINLNEANGILEAKVSERTAELESLNGSLQKEILERTQAEEDLKSTLKENQALLKEIHHRVKNNLQIISSLLQLQSRRIHDSRALDLLLDSQNRVKSMALVHERLYGSEDLGHIGFAGYLKDLTGQLFRSFDAEGRGIGLDLDLEDIPMSVDTAVPCGLIIHELVSNALKHAFPPERVKAGVSAPRLTLRCASLPRGGFEMEVGDNGMGLPPDLDITHTRSLGMQLVNTLVKQLGGTLEAARGERTAFLVRVVPKEEKESAHE
jgi:two-component sensor histidine kinase/CheY-like chemotaxis protein